MTSALQASSQGSEVWTLRLAISCWLLQMTVLAHLACQETVYAFRVRMLICPSFSLCFAFSYLWSACMLPANYDAWVFLYLALALVRCFMGIRTRRGNAYSCYLLCWSEDSGQIQSSLFPPSEVAGSLLWFGLYDTKLTFSSLFLRWELKRSTAHFQGFQSMDYDDAYYQASLIRRF